MSEIKNGQDFRGMESGAYELQIAGRAWAIDPMKLMMDPQGQRQLTEADIRMLRLAVANCICNEDSELRQAEFELLCELTRSSYKEVATYLRKDKSTVSRWANKAQIDYAESRLLKDYFWNKLFGDLDRRRSDLIGRHEMTCLKRGLPKVQVAS
jgi:hypothetical protein